MFEFFLAIHNKREGLKIIIKMLAFDQEVGGQYQNQLANLFLLFLLTKKKKKVNIKIHFEVLSIH